MRRYSRRHRQARTPGTSARQLAGEFSNLNIQVVEQRAKYRECGMKPAEVIRSTRNQKAWISMSLYIRASQMHVLSTRCKRELIKEELSGGENSWEPKMAGNEDRGRRVVIGKC